MNKNISIWRGSEAPPTLNHIWVKEGSFLIYINDEWKLITDPDLQTKIEIYISNSLEEQNRNTEETLNQFKQTIDQKLETQSTELEDYVSEEVAKIQDKVQEPDILKLQSVDLNNGAEISNIINKLSEDTIQFYKITNKPSYLNNIEENDVCYFNRTTKENLHEDVVINSNYSLLFNDEYYHLVFGDPFSYATFAIEDIDSECYTRNPEIKDSQLWRLIGNPSSFVIQNKNGKYLYYDDSYNGGMFRTSFTTKDSFKLNKSYLSDINCFNIELLSKPGNYINSYQGSKYGTKASYWQDATNEGNQICIVQFKTEDIFSNDMVTKTYIIYLNNKRSDRFAIGLHNVTPEDHQAKSYYISDTYDNTHITEEYAYWKFIGNPLNLQVESIKFPGYYLYFDGLRFGASNVPWQAGYKLTFSYKNGQQYFNISFNDKDRATLRFRSYTNNDGIDCSNSQSEYHSLMFSLVNQEQLNCNVITKHEDSIFKNYPQIEGNVLDITLHPNTFYVWGQINELTVNLGDEIPGITNEYLFQFSSGETPTVLNLPNDIKWANGKIPSIQSYNSYLIKIINKLGTFTEFI